MNNKTFTFDSTNPKLLRTLIADLGDSETMFITDNTEGERMTISISTRGIVTSTFQGNGWVRVNSYDADGYPDGETFDGRWK